MDNYCFNCFQKIGSGFCPYCGYKNGSSAEQYPLALPEGSVLGGRYIIGRVLGQGGFGITYVAQDFKTKGLVAIKEFFPDSLVTRTNRISVSTISVDRRENFAYGKDCFLNEAKTLAQFNDHPNIVHIYSYSEENNTAYFAMEYLEGKSFLEYLKRVSSISWEETRKILDPVMDALEFVHSRGIVHRDISPDNIFLCNDGTVKLIDFGAARYSLGDRSHSLSVVLKHGFAPHEQYARRGRQGPFTDVYALAATMYRAITGNVPPEATDRVYEDSLVLPSSMGIDIPEHVENALVKALAFNYSERYQTITEFRLALDTPPAENKIDNADRIEQARENIKTEGAGDNFSPVAAQSETEKKKKKSKKPFIAIAAALVVVAGAVAALMLSGVLNGGDSEDDSVWRSGKATVDGIVYRLNGNKAVVYDHTDDFTAEDLVIPEEVGGYPVTTINNNAFDGCEQIKNITLSDNIEEIKSGTFDNTEFYKDESKWEDGVLYIGKYLYSSNDSVPSSYSVKDGTISICNASFSNNSSLKSITIPESVKYIGNSAFYACNKLENIDIPDSVTHIGSSAFFKTGYYNDSINWEDNVLYIGKYLVDTENYSDNYSSETSLGYYKIKEGTVTIASFAFNNVETLSIPSSVTNIGEGALNSEKLTEINVDENNEYFSSYDGNLYNKDKTQLIAYAAGKKDSDFTIPDSVTTIGGYAFYESQNLEKINIPDTVTVIQEDSFACCKKLQTVSIPNSVSSIGAFAFSLCDVLENAYIPDNVAAIGAEAFRGCDQLTSITVDEDNDDYSSLDGNLYNSDQTELLQYALGKTDTSFTIPDGVTELGESAFYGSNLEEISIPDGITAISESAFCYCEKLETISIPDTVTSIGESAFYYCEKLETVSIPESVTAIGESAFEYCSALKNTTIPNSVKTIGEDSFFACGSLTEIDIPQSVTYIGNEAFLSCTKLTEINVDSGNSYYTSDDGVLYNKEKTELIVYPTGKTNSYFSIPEGVETIDYGALYSNDNIMVLTIPESVKTIDSYAFYCCLELFDVTIEGDNLETIDYYAFKDCNISEISLPYGCDYDPEAFDDTVDIKYKY